MDDIQKLFFTEWVTERKLSNTSPSMRSVPWVNEYEKKIREVLHSCKMNSIYPKDSPEFLKETMEKLSEPYKFSKYKEMQNKTSEDYWRQAKNDLSEMNSFDSRATEMFGQVPTFFWGNDRIAPKDTKFDSPWYSQQTSIPKDHKMTNAASPKEQSTPLVPEGYKSDLTALLGIYLTQYINKRGNQKEQQEVVIELYNMMSSEQKTLIIELHKFVMVPNVIPLMMLTMDLKLHHERMTGSSAQPSDETFYPINVGDSDPDNDVTKKPELRINSARTVVQPRYLILSHLLVIAPLEIHGLEEFKSNTRNTAMKTQSYRTDPYRFKLAPLTFVVNEEPLLVMQQFLDVNDHAVFVIFDNDYNKELEVFRINRDLTIHYLDESEQLIQIGSLFSASSNLLKINWIGGESVDSLFPEEFMKELQTEFIKKGCFYDIEPTIIKHIMKNLSKFSCAAVVNKRIEKFLSN